MNGERKNRAGILITFIVFLIFLLTVVVFAVILRHKAQMQQKEIVQLQTELDSLQEELALAQEEKSSLEQSVQEQQEQLAAYEAEKQQREEQEQKEQEALEQSMQVDMAAIPAGSVIEDSQINWENPGDYFCAYEIPDDVYERINGKSYRENNNIGLDDLRYLKMLHYNFKHQIQMGEMIVNVAVAEDVMNIFRELFEAEYEVQSMFLIDNYWTGDGDTSDSASIEVNNTSAFCYRAVTGGSNLSNHAYGRAIDLNPQQNPYVSYRSGSPSWSHENANAYIDRSTGLPHVITHDDLAYQVFAKYGFSWGGDWNTIKDYQHFEKE